MFIHNWHSWDENIHWHRFLRKVSLPQGIKRSALLRQGCHNLVNGSVPTLPCPSWLCAIRSCKTNLVLLAIFCSWVSCDMEKESQRTKICSSVKLCLRHCPVARVCSPKGCPFTEASLQVFLSQPGVSDAGKGDPMQQSQSQRQRIRNCSVQRRPPPRQRAPLTSTAHSPVGWHNVCVPSRSFHLGTDCFSAQAFKLGSGVSC